MHKYYKNKVANLINYMTASNENSFYCLIKLSSDDDYWGITLDGERFCAAHILEKTHRVLSDHEEAEKEAIKKGKLFPVLFYGTDNTSYLMRFVTKAQAKKFLDEIEEFSSFDHETFYYNS